MAFRFAFPKDYTHYNYYYVLDGGSRGVLKSINFVEKLRQIVANYGRGKVKPISSFNPHFALKVKKTDRKLG